MTKQERNIQRLKTSLSALAIWAMSFTAFYYFAVGVTSL